MAERGAIRALSDQDRNPYSPTLGCFDRRYWAWKLVDFPESTFQRHVYPLARLYANPRSRLYQQTHLRDAVVAGLNYALLVQHRNGSFDQAFPYEHSWGATAFLLHPLCVAAAAVDSTDSDRRQIKERLAAAAEFLCRHGERHGRITNHLAGGALSLYTAARFLEHPPFGEHATTVLADILASQSSEGWFPEYDGADPGYQSLCLYYLSEIARVAPSPQLDAAIDRSIDFLSWFVHPDGTFGGLYGSRRTRVPYLGGFARASERSERAAAIYQTLAAAVLGGATISVDTIDSGNLAPLLSNLVCACEHPLPAAVTSALPSQQPSQRREFPEAGLFVRSTTRYYAICGVRNGATVTVFDRPSRTLRRDDGGYVGRLTGGTLVTSQVCEARAASVSDDTIAATVRFARMGEAQPTPALFLVLRLLNLTVMRSLWLGNAVKRLMVWHLLRAGKPVPLTLIRTVRFAESVEIEDRLETQSRLSLQWLRGGRAFSSIHMASAGYFEGALLHAPAPAAVDVDVDALARDGVVTIRHTVS